MNSDTVDFLMGQPDGANYVVLYQMLCLKTINTNGRMSRQIGEIIIPYDVEKIRRDCKWFTADTIRVALTLFQQFGLIYEDVDGTLVLADHENLVGSETNYARQKRNQRALTVQSQKTISGQTVDIGVDIVHPDIRDKDIRDLDTREEEDKNVCTEPLGASVLSLILNDKSEYTIYQYDIDEWSELYPAVDVLQELRKMKGWCKDNPSKRKTRKGIRRFIGNWLAREQDKGGTARYSQRQPAKKNTAMDDLRELHELFREEDGQ